MGNQRKQLPLAFKEHLRNSNKAILEIWDKLDGEQKFGAAQCWKHMERSNKQTNGGLSSLELVAKAIFRQTTKKPKSMKKKLRAEEQAKKKAEWDALSPEEKEQKIAKRKAKQLKKFIAKSPKYKKLLGLNDKKKEDPLKAMKKQEAINKWKERIVHVRDLQSNAVNEKLPPPKYDYTERKTIGMLQPLKKENNEEE
jgi:hypothetical protein